MPSKSVIHTLTGLFLLVAFGLGGLALLARPTLQGWLGTVRLCETWLPEAYVKRDDPVEFRSYRIGRVARIEPHPWHTESGANWFQVTLTVDEAWADAVTDEFRVTVSLGPLGALTGSSLVLLAPGEKRTLDPHFPAERRGRAIAELPRDDAIRLEFVAPQSLVDELSARARTLLDDLAPKAEEIVVIAKGIVEELAREDGDLFTFVSILRSRAEWMQAPLEDLAAVLVEMRALSKSFNAPEGEVQQLLGSMTSIAAALEAGEGVVGGLLREGDIKQETIELFRRTNAVLEETRGLLAATQVTMGEVNASATVLPDAAAQLGEVVTRLEAASRMLPGFAEELRRVLEQTNIVLTGVRESAVLNVIADFETPPAGEPIVLPAGSGGGGR